MILDWIPEVYPATGGLAADGFYKLLGRPALDPLTVLVRETAQNSWDARLGESQPVDYRISGYILSAEQRIVLEGSVLPSGGEIPGLDDHTALADDSVAALVISDRNTKGLGGPVLGYAEDRDGVYDWVDFVLNAGKANTQGETGGTYGFGKTISYIVSQVNTVVIHSHASIDGEIQPRLIACAIGGEFSREGRLCTGRHWWGRREGDSALPVEGDEADVLAEAIGMPAIGKHETGTNVMIVAPDFGGRTYSQAMSFIVESILWHLWPKLIERAGVAPMRISIDWNGTEIPLPPLETRPPLHAFAQAFRALLRDIDLESAEAVGLRKETVNCKRPKVLTGDLVSVAAVQRARVPVDDGHREDDVDSPRPAASIVGPSHHIALMRAPELVVTYLTGPVPPEGGIEWAAVFRCRPELDAQFALAEPPTHDSWNPDLLPRGQDRTIVNVTLREIWEAMERRWQPAEPSGSGDPMSVARIADDLAHLVHSQPASGPGRVRGGGTPAPPRRKAGVDVKSAKPVCAEGSPATRVVMQVTPTSGSERTVVRISVAAALDGVRGSTEVDPDLQVAAITGEAVTSILDGTAAEVTVSGSKRAEFEILIRRGPDTTVLIDATTEAEA